MNDKIKSLLGILFIVALFIIVSYFVRQNSELVKTFIGDGIAGILIYILTVIVAIVVAPISMVPFIPIASTIWGWFYAAVFSIIGWSLGAFAVFFISRKFGVPLVRKFVSFEKINKIEGKIPAEDLFFSIILLRMIIPVDVLSYAISLFTKVDFKTYASATIIGITPFAFVFSYLGVVPFIYQVEGFIVSALIVILISYFYKKRYKK